MKTLRIRNWDKWQSYRKDRGQPPWIKIHRQLMRDPNWVELTDAQRGQLVAIWLLAADRDGVIPASPATLRKLCFMETEPDLNLFIDHGFVEAASDGCQDDANRTPERRQDDVPEKRRGEAEKRREEEIGACAPDEVIFSGTYVRKITAKTVKAWLETFATLDSMELRAELALCDEYYSGQEKQPDNWFFTTMAWIKREHDRRMKVRRDADEDERRIYAGVQ